MCFAVFGALWREIGCKTDSLCDGSRLALKDVADDAGGRVVGAQGILSEG